MGATLGIGPLIPISIKVEINVNVMNMAMFVSVGALVKNTVKPV